MTAKKEYDLLITSMITEWIGWHKVLLPLINHNNYNCWKAKKSNLKTSNFSFLIHTISERLNSEESFKNGFQQLSEKAYSDNPVHHGSYR